MTEEAARAAIDAEDAAEVADGTIAEEEYTFGSTLDATALAERQHDADDCTIYFHSQAAVLAEGEG